MVPEKVALVVAGSEDIYSRFLKKKMGAGRDISLRACCIAKSLANVHVCIAAAAIATAVRS